MLWSSQAKPSHCSQWGMAAGLRSGVSSSSPLHDHGKGGMLVEGMRLPGPVQSFFPPQIFPLCPGCFGVMSSPVGMAPCWSAVQGPLQKARAAHKLRLRSLSPCLG